MKLQLLFTIGTTALLVAGGLVNLEPTQAADVSGIFSYTGFFTIDQNQNSYKFYDVGQTTNPNNYANIDISGNEGSLGSAVGNSGQIYDVNNTPTTPFISFTNGSSNTLDLTSIGPVSKIEVPISFFSNIPTPNLQNGNSGTPIESLPSWFTPEFASLATKGLAFPDYTSTVTFSVIPTVGTFSSGTDTTTVFGGITTPSDVLSQVNPTVPLSLAGIFIAQVPEPSNAPGAITLGAVGLAFFARNWKQFA